LCLLTIEMLYELGKPEKQTYRKAQIPRHSENTQARKPSRFNPLSII
jgi:hypothetical protein